MSPRGEWLSPPPGATTFELDRLPTVSPWPGRLLQLSPWQRRDRTTEKNLREYDGEKYARVLDWLEGASPSERTPAAAQGVIDASWTGGPCVVSFKDALWQTDGAAFDAFRAEVFARHVVPLLAEDARAIVELGSGFGYQLSTVRSSTTLPLAGGDLSPKAVQIAAAVFRPEDRTKVVPFNFLDDPSYDDVLAATGVRDGITIFTSHALSMLPSARPFLDSLRKRRDRIRRVVHLEPVTGMFDAPTLLDQLRVAYARDNDYNLDVLDLLGADGVTVEHREKDLLGANPLTPLNLLVWRFD